jgi:hypothetical protein
MPPPAKEIKPHPTSVNDLLLRQLMEAHPHLTLKKFLQTQLSCISADLSGRLIGGASGTWRAVLDGSEWRVVLIGMEVLGIDRLLTVVWPAELGKDFDEGESCGAITAKQVWARMC